MRKLGRLVRWSVAATALFTSAACSDGVTAPTSARPQAPKLDIIVNRMAADSSSADFTVTSTGGVFQIGPHSIYFPKNSICNPTISTYGASEWDKPCTPQYSPIKIHAEVRNIDGHQWVDFTPSLRFVPSTNGSTWVWIWMYTGQSAASASSLNILWAPGFGMEPVDESIADPSLRTGTYGNSIVYRRIKHFSGYMVAAGRRASMEAPDLGGEGM